MRVPAGICTRSCKEVRGRGGSRTRRAAAVEVPIMQMSDAERAAMAAELGYKQIGKEVPASVSLTDVVKTMPQR